MMLKSRVLGKGDALIILHGLFGDSKNWMSCASILAKKFEVHLVDLRNHGASFHADTHNYELMADDVYEYVCVKNLNNYSILGHSMGGKVAMQYALIRHDSGLNRLIIIDIAPKKYLENHSDIFSALQEVVKLARSRKEAFSILEKKINNSLISNFLLKSLVIHKQGHLSFNFNLKSLENNLENIMDRVWSDKPYTGKVVFFSGEQSDYISSSDYKYMFELFPFMKVVTIPNSGHWVHYENKSGFLSELNNYLIN